MKSESTKERMLKLIGSFDNKKEVYLESINKKVVSTDIQSEKKRLSELISDEKNKLFKENAQSFYYTPANFKSAQGKTVNSIVDDLNKDNAGNRTNVSRVPLQPEEAFEVAIKRTLKSGAPVNNISFYDEVNWHLMGLGFTTKNPIDIKNEIAKMLEK